jgi:hypothetical protein
VSARGLTASAGRSGRDNVPSWDKKETRFRPLRAASGRARWSLDFRPNQARILDATGRPVAESSTSRRCRPAQIVLHISQSVAAAVESGGWSAFRVDVEVDEIWHGAVLVDQAQPVVELRSARQAAFRVVS